MTADELDSRYSPGLLHPGILHSISYTKNPANFVGRHTQMYFKHFIKDTQSSLDKPRQDYITSPTEQLNKHYFVIHERKSENFNKV